MSNSLRKRLRADVINALETLIDGTGEYNNVIGKVSRNLKHPEEESIDQFPVLAVINGNEDKIDGDEDEIVNTLQVIITGYVYDTEDTTDVLDDLIEDIERAVTADRFRNNLAVNTLVMNIKNDEGSMEPFGICQLSVKVSYHQSYGNPETN